MNDGRKDEIDAEIRNLLQGEETAIPATPEDGLRAAFAHEEAPAADPANRRPLASRQSARLQQMAADLANRGVSPNLISQASVGFAAAGLLVFWLSAHAGAVLGGILLFFAAAAIVARLVCNLLDGLVAIEGGRGEADGPFWNEAPDRLSDILLFWGAGIAAGNAALGLGLGALAVACAYLREFGRAEGFPPDFSGPGAKQHRMAALAVVAALAALAPLFWTRIEVMGWGLWLIGALVAATIIRRSWRLIAALRARAERTGG